MSLVVVITRKNISGDGFVTEYHQIAVNEKLSVSDNRVTCDVSSVRNEPLSFKPSRFGEKVVILISGVEINKIIH